jgi:hypothetical protein
MSQSKSGEYENTLNAQNFRIFAHCGSSQMDKVELRKKGREVLAPFSLFPPAQRSAHGGESGP